MHRGGTGGVAPKATGWWKIVFYAGTETEYGS